MQLMGVAEFFIGRAFARPGDPTHPTRFLEHSLCGVDDRVEQRPLSKPYPPATKPLVFSLSRVPEGRWPRAALYFPSYGHVSVETAFSVWRFVYLVEI